MLTASQLYDVLWALYGLDDDDSDGNAAIATIGAEVRRRSSRRELRRARKQRKNAVMWKTVGRRPWLPPFKTWCTLQWAADSARRRRYDINNKETFIGGYYVDDNHNIHMSDFRERGGFLLMSRVAREVGQ